MGNTETPALLYHYCGLGALVGIIESKCLWMSSVYWMDDTTEMVWLNRVLRERIAELGDDRSQVHERFDKLLHDTRLTPVYRSCLSEDPDLTSQWIQYGDQGHGFAIGFETAALDLKRPPPKRNVELSRVVYDETQQRTIADEIVDGLENSVHELTIKLNVAFGRINTWWEAARCKNPKFSTEREWRLIMRDDPQADLEYQTRGGRHLVPFTTFPIDPETDPIKEIWLGPRNRSQRNVDAVASLLRSRGFRVEGVKFRGSEVPLR